MIIRNNLPAIGTRRWLKINEEELKKSISHIASGERITRSGEDPSGLAVSEKMRTQIRGLIRAERNTEDGMSLIQTAEGYLSEVSSILQRIRELAVQAANGIYTPEDRQLMQVEVSQLIDEVDRIASQAEFNTMKLLLGHFAKTSTRASLWLHMGANMHQRERIYISTMTARALNLKTPAGGIASLSTPDLANRLIGIVDNALSILNKQRADLGAYYNRLEHSARGLMVAYENIQAAESRIRDADIAEEMIRFTTQQILVEGGVAMLAQANFLPRGALRLLAP